jgi:hypothetical protein
MALPVNAASVETDLSVRATVSLSPEYEWLVRRQSPAVVVDSLRAGDILTVAGRLQRAPQQPLAKQTVVLLLGRQNEVVHSTQTVTSAEGGYQLSLPADQSWRGDYWVSVVVMTYGRPLWLVNRQTVTWLAPQMGQPARQVTWQIDGVLTAVWKGDNTQPVTDGYRATIKPNANIINDVERRVCPSFVTPLARGRDSPVTDRYFGVG